MRRACWHCELSLQQETCTPADQVSAAASDRDRLGHGYGDGQLWPANANCPWQGQLIVNIVHRVRSVHNEYMNYMKAACYGGNNHANFFLAYSSFKYWYLLSIS